jgi:hypothetical protein
MGEDTERKALEDLALPLSAQHPDAAAGRTKPTG